MISLGDGPFRPKECRDTVLAELRHAGVTNIVTEEMEVQVLDRGCPAAQTPPGIVIPSLERSYHPETHFKVGGKLPGWELYRAWTYWIVSCKKLVDEIHAKDAMALFKEHGQKMRVDGHCGCPKPEGSYLRHHCRVGMNLVEGGTDITLDGKHHVFVPKGAESWAEVFEKINKENPGPRGGVHMYHIDTQEAFDAFCKYISFRTAKRKEAEEAYQKEQIAKDNWKWDFQPQLDGFIAEKEFSTKLICADAVHAIAENCLYTDEEKAAWGEKGTPPEDSVVVRGLRHNFGFHPGRLESHREAVKKMLLNLPRSLMASVRGGYSFKAMSFDKDNNLWCEQITAESLLVLGIGLGLVSYCAPRPMWEFLPHELPYVIVHDSPEEPAEEELCPKKPEKNESPSSPSAQAASEAATTARGESS